MQLYLYGEKINTLEFFKETLRSEVGDVAYEVLSKQIVPVGKAWTATRGIVTFSGIVEINLTSAQLLKLGSALGQKITCEVIKETEDESDAPLEVLDQSVTKLRKALATGDYDLYLQALLEAEQAGKTRKTAVEAIQERLDAAG